MKVMWKAACVAVLLVAATSIEIGCGQTYRPVATPLPATTGNPSGFEAEVVLSCCLSPDATNNVSHVPSSVITNIDVSGDTNVGNKVLANVANSVVFDGSRTTVFTTNPATAATSDSVAVPDSVTQVLLGTSTAGFSALTTTISLEAGSTPIGMSFEYFGPTYPLDFVVNKGTQTATCPGSGSVTAIAEVSSEVVATVCVGPTPVLAWIYRDQTKIFVLDTDGTVRVIPVGAIGANTFKVTNIIQVGGNPIRVAQSANGQYIYILDGSSGGKVTILDGQAETIVGTVTPVLNSACISGGVLICNSPLVDMAQDLNFNDTANSTQINHLWLLHANGTVSVYDGSTPGQLSWITSLATTSTVSPTALPTNLALMRDGTQAYVGVMGTDKIIAINTSKLSSNAVTQNATTPITVGMHLPDATATLTDTVTVTSTSTVKTYSGTVLVGGATTPTVTYVAVSRGGASGTANVAELSKAYVATTTTTTYYCYDEYVLPTSCSNNTYVWGSGSTAAITIQNPTDPPPPVPFLPPVPYLGANPACTALPQITTGPNAGLYAMSCQNLYNGTAVVYAVGNGTIPINTYVTTIPTPAVVTNCNPGNPATGVFDGQKNCPLMVPSLILGRS